MIERSYLELQCAFSVILVLLNIAQPVADTHDFCEVRLRVCLPDNSLAFAKCID